MIDLHLHFDGSLLPRTILELAEEQGISLPARDPDELKLFLTAPKDCRSLNEYLEKFDLPLLVLQTREAIRKGMYTLLCSLKEQGMLYAEVRFAPQSHLKKGLTQEEVVKAAVLGMQEAAAGSFFKAQLILCCMRGADSEKANRETIRLAAEFFNDHVCAKVCAVDLAGAEALFPTRSFSDLFAFARELDVPFTIHAGEAAGAESIEAALSFGARRLGHGVRVIERPELLEEIIEKQIPLELCMTSNLQTKALPQSTDYPLLYLLRRGAVVTVNTDNMTVSGTTIAHEYAALRAMGMTAQEEKLLLKHGVEAAFLPEMEKERLRETIEKLFSA